MKESTQTQVTEASQASELAVVVQDAERAALAIAEPSVLESISATKKVIASQPDVPVITGDNDLERANNAVAIIAAWHTTERALREVEEELGRKKASQTAYYLWTIASQGVLFGNPKDNPQSLWADERSMCEALGEKSGMQYLAAWRMKSKMEADGAVCSVPPAANPEHAQKGLSVYQRIFCRFQLDGVREWRKAEKVITDLNDLALLLRAVEQGASVTDASGKDIALPSVRLSHGSDIAIRVAMLQAARKPLPKTDAPKSEDAPKTDAPKTDATTKSSVNESPAVDPEWTVKQAEIDKVASNPLPLDSEGAIDTLHAVMLASIESAGAFYVAQQKAIAAYRASLDKMQSIARQMPVSEFQKAAYKAVCEDVQKVCGIQLYGVLTTAVSEGETARKAAATPAPAPSKPRK